MSEKLAFGGVEELTDKHRFRVSNRIYFIIFILIQLVLYFIFG